MSKPPHDTNAVHKAKAAALKASPQSVRPSSPTYGRTHIGPYKLIKQLGKGGMGTVWLASQESLNRKVAIKVVGKDDAAAVSEENIQRFLREAKALARIINPTNVVAVYDSGWYVSGGQRRPYLVMEYVEGSSLIDLLRTQGTFHPHHAAKLAHEILKGLEAIHKAGLVHRDLKPENVLVCRDSQRAKILDFGLVQDKVHADNRLTQAGMALGSVNYMSPEQGLLAKDGRPVDCRSDIYALGIMMYEFLTGRVPFPQREDVQKNVAFLMMLEAHRDIPLPPLPSHVPSDLAAIIRRAAAKNPDDRFQSATEMRRALESLTRIRRASSGPKLPQEASRSSSSAPKARAASSSGKRRPSLRDIIPEAYQPKEDAPAEPQAAGGKGIPPPAPARKRNRFPYVAGGLVALALIAGALLWTTFRPGQAPQDDVPRASERFQKPSVPEPDAASAETVLGADEGCKAYRSDDKDRALAILKPLAARGSLTEASHLLCLCKAAWYAEDPSRKRYCDAYRKHSEAEPGEAAMIEHWFKDL